MSEDRGVYSVSAKKAAVKDESVLIYLRRCGERSGAKMIWMINDPRSVPRPTPPPFHTWTRGVRYSPHSGCLLKSGPWTCDNWLNSERTRDEYWALAGDMIYTSTFSLINKKNTGSKHVLDHSARNNFLFIAWNFYQTFICFVKFNSVCYFIQKHSLDNGGSLTLPQSWSKIIAPAYGQMLFW